MTAPRYTGARVARREDPRLLRGEGCFLDDVTLPGVAAVVFARCPHAHAALRAIRVAEAWAMPGVVAVYVGEDFRGEVRPLAPRLDGGGFESTAWATLTDGTARYCGEPVAAIVAESAALAADARDRLEVEYEPLPAVGTLAPDGGDVLFCRHGERGDVDGGFARAAIVVRETFRHGRCAASPMEPRGMVAAWDGARLTVYASTQVPAILRTILASSLGLEASAVRVLVPDTGGGFGLKMQVFPEEIAVAAVARRLGRPVKWVEDRRENLGAASQAREQEARLEVAADAAGQLLALRVRLRSDAGAYHSYPLTQALEPLGTAMILPGPYLTPAYRWEAMAVRTNKPPLGAYRGVGMTMGAFVMERALDLVAGRTGLDPAEIRRRNLIPRAAYPFVSASGSIYDSGDHQRGLDRLLAAADYAGLRRWQGQARAAGRWVGIGLACYTEYTGMGSEVFRVRGMAEVPGPEAARVALGVDGTVRCAVTFPTQGQGHATAISQVIADRVGVPLELVAVLPVDTDSVASGSGTFGSRGAVAMMGAVGAAAAGLRSRIVHLAARLLEASADDIAVRDGRASVRGVPGRGLSLAEVARAAARTDFGAAHPSSGDLGAGPGDGGAGLEETVSFDPPGPTYSGAVHLAVVEVDRETGRPVVLRYALVEDCGPLINPLLVEGQIHGAVAQGIGEALLEELVHDERGQLLTATLMDYALPKASDVPTPEIEHLETPSPWMPGGVKGMGEGGTIGAPAAIANAVADAVRHAGIAITALPIRARDLVRMTPCP